MGSPWPWPQEPVKNSTSGSSLTTIQNNKRTNYGYPSYSSYYYNNQHNNHDLSQQHNLHHHQHSPHHQSSNHQHHRLPPPPPSEPDHMITNEIVMRKRALPPYFSFDCVPHPHHQHHSPTNNNYPSRKPPMAPSNSQQSQFATSVKEIPTWNIYYSDQKHRIIDFTDKNNSIRPDSYINQLVSLCFVDTCITNFSVDAIVNSTTEDYSGVAGVDKLIHQKAGRNLREACKSLPRLRPGQAEMTLGFSLPAKYVIHTNGPLTDDAEQLTGCYNNSLNILRMHSLRTIVFPCISAGKKGLTKKFAAATALRTVRRFLEKHKHEVDRVIFCLHHQKDIEIYLRYMQIYFPVVDDREFRIAIA